MSKFNKVAANKASSSTTKEFPILGIGSMPEAKLIGKCASRINTAYTSACLTASMGIQRKMASSKNKGVLLNQNQNNKLGPLVSYVITGWSGVFDDTGTEVPYSVEDCIDLLKALPSSMFDEVILFFENEANFSPAEAGDAVKN